MEKKPVNKAGTKKQTVKKIPAKKEPVKTGCPPMYKTVEEMKEKIDEYFNSFTQAELIYDKDGNQVFNKDGSPAVRECKPVTVTGLALHLGFTSRQALLNYQHKEPFVDTVTRAKLKIERYAEERLYDRDGVNGAKFSLANNFGWSEKKEVEMNANVNAAEKVETIASQLFGTEDE